MLYSLPFHTFRGEYRENIFHYEHRTCSYRMSHILFLWDQNEPIGRDFLCFFFQRWIDAAECITFKYSVPVYCLWKNEIKWIVIITSSFLTEFFYLKIVIRICRVQFIRIVLIDSVCIVSNPSSREQKWKISSLYFQSINVFSLEKQTGDAKGNNVMNMTRTRRQQINIKMNK